MCYYVIKVSDSIIPHRIVYVNVISATNRNFISVDNALRNESGKGKENGMDTKEIFAQRVIELRKEKGINQAQLAERVGVSKTSANLYESATRVPDIQVLARYAKELEVTSDYLLGLSDNRTAETAAIGDKLGLSDEAIKQLLLIMSINKELELSAEGKEKGRRRYTALLSVINSMISNFRLISAIRDYIFGWCSEIAIDYKSLEDQFEISIKKETADELKEAIEALNIHKVQLALSLLRDEYKKTPPAFLPVDINAVKEDTDAEENKREE